MKMASEDVIELGSSDDEAEPAPKKKKPALNAMVHFPNKVPGLTIKPQKSALPPLQKVLAGGSITITKMGKPSTLVNKTKHNIRPVQKIPQKVGQRIQKLNTTRPLIKPAVLQNLKPNMAINPINVMKIHQASKLSLPPGITVKRTAAGQKISPELSITRKRPTTKRKPPEKITTVELDDEVVPVTFRPNPQWYLRPEEQMKQPDTKEEVLESALETEKTMEEENNKEPDTTKYIEITIDDSPVKPVPSKRLFEVGTELAITIEDSPVKAAEAELCASGSDSEMTTSTTPNSKKKLEYHKNEEDLIKNKTGSCCIHLEKRSGTEETEQCKNNFVDQQKVKKDIEKKETLQESTVKRIPPVIITKEVGKTNPLESRSENSEFHPVYQRFIDLCFEIENSDDMTKIVEKKIKTYYRQCPKEYVESEEFIDMVSSKTFAMKAGPDKMYLYIKDIVDELNLQRKTAKAIDQISNKENKTENDNFFYNDVTECDSKKARQIRKLEKTIKKIHRAIQKLEEQEVEFDDEEDSVYLLTERYKERLVKVYAKFCQLSNTKMPSEPRIQIEARPGQPTGPAKRLEKWVNTKVPIGTPLPFPDFHDVLRCVRDANEEDRLGWNEADVMEEARDLFTRCGRKLQRRRQENEWRIAASRITHDTTTADPAEKSDVLRKKLDENKVVAAKKETELFNKYADKQNQLKLIGEEIGDKEAEESPVESEDEEVNDDGNSLENKQKRKERLKRLLHEKTRKMSVENELRDNEEENPISEKTENKQQTEEKECVTEVMNNAPIIEDNKIDNNNQKEEKIIDNTFDIDSDIDELHLLQKLYSENEMNSSNQSDSDSPIAISDSLDSESETEKVTKHRNYDVISIEDSSYSESEMSKEERSKEQESKYLKNKNVEVESLKYGSETVKSDENILLTSSEEDNDNTETHLQSDNICDIKNTFENKKLINDVIDEIILDDCDENVEKNEEAEIFNSNKVTTEGNVAKENKTVASIEQKDLNTSGKITAVIIENNELNNDSIDSPKEVSSTQNSEGSCKIVSLSETGNTENIDNKINDQTNINHCELPSNISSSEIVYDTKNQDKIEANVSLQTVGFLDENHKSSPNRIKIVSTENKCNEGETAEDCVKIISTENKFNDTRETAEDSAKIISTENKLNECKTAGDSVKLISTESKLNECAEDMKMDISEHFESESLKDLQTNVDKNV